MVCFCWLNKLRCQKAYKRYIRNRKRHKFFVQKLEKIYFITQTVLQSAFTRTANIAISYILLNKIFTDEINNFKLH